MRKALVEKIEKEIEQKNKLSEESKKEIFARVFNNYIIAILVLIYFILITLGKIYLEQNIFILSCRISTFAILAATIILFEISYKKDKGAIAIYGIELMAISIFTLFIPYMFYELDITIVNYLMLTGIYMSAYYIIKSIFIYKYHKKKHIKSLNDVKEIVKKESKKRKHIDVEDKKMQTTRAKRNTIERKNNTKKSNTEVKKRGRPRKVAK